ncbi:unnamed protein product [Brassica oleracea var. botrytis]|uniref:(rape) hypothetical protein n=1 Tax=Brassica napus TaxID=3708 RepID=A0A816I8D2_BRANA|nr:unnamed protein product [Brassica napus]
MIKLQNTLHVQLFCVFSFKNRFVISKPKQYISSE